MEIEIEPFEVEVIADAPWPALEATTGAGVARLVASMLARAGVEATADAGAICGRLWISDRWQAEITVGGERRAEEAAFDQCHHLLYRLTEYTALQLGGTLPETVTRAFEDLRTVSPGAMLAYLAGLGAEDGARARLWQRAFELDARQVAARTGLARELLERGEARAAAGLVLGIEIEDAAAAAELGIGIWASVGASGGGEEAEAVSEVAAQLLQAAVKANPEDAIAASALAALLARRGAQGRAPHEMLDEALLLATQATQLASDDFRCWAALADVHRATGDFAQASFFYGFALKLAPEAPSVLKDAGACWLLARQPAEALPLIKRALAVAPGDAENFGNLAFARDLLGEAEAALEAARQAAALSPSDVRLLILRGDLAHKAGERDEALEAWARAVEIAPGVLINPEGGNILGMEDESDGAHGDGQPGN